jgi:hypothetical protein
MASTIAALTAGLARATPLACVVVEIGAGGYKIMDKRESMRNKKTAYRFCGINMYAGRRRAWQGMSI